MQITHLLLACIGLLAFALAEQESSDSEDLYASHPASNLVREPLLLRPDLPSVLSVNDPELTFGIPSISQTSNKDRPLLGWPCKTRQQGQTRCAKDHSTILVCDTQRWRIQDMCNNSCCIRGKDKMDKAACLHPDHCPDSKYDGHFKLRRRDENAPSVSRECEFSCMMVDGEDVCVTTAKFAPGGYARDFSPLFNHGSKTKAKRGEEPDNHMLDTRCNPRNFTEIERFEKGDWVTHGYCMLPFICKDTNGIGLCHLGNSFVAGSVGNDSTVYIQENGRNTTAWAPGILLRKKCVGKEIQYFDSIGMATAGVCHDPYDCFDFNGQAGYAFCRSATGDIRLPWPVDSA